MDPASLHRISYGLYVVCSASGDRKNGQIVNSFFQVTSRPPIVAVSINKDNLTHELIEASGLFTVTVLSRETPMSFIGTFGFRSGRDADKFHGVRWKAGVTGAPVVLENAAAYFEAGITGSIDAGTHTIFLGKVEEAETLSDARVMTYEYYHKVKGGVSPKNSPTYSESSDATGDPREGAAGDGTGAGKMKRYVCTVCGYIYDPEKGDGGNGVEPGTAFENLPDSWVCPLCGAGKDDFRQE